MPVELLKKIIKYFYKFTVKISIFEYQPINKKKIRLKINFFSINLKNKKKKKYILKNYFKNNQEKYKRLKSSTFFYLENKNEIISSGWVCVEKNKKWNIEEIDKKINFKDKNILYDFETAKKFRNKGYYTLLLKLIQNKFLKKKLLIYTHESNKASVRAITKSGFEFKYNLKKY
jgi:predicted transcriptional regulator YheO